MGTAIIILFFVWALLPSIVLYGLAFLGLRYVFRRLPNRRAKWFLIGALIIAALVPYGPELMAYQRVKRWAASETVTHKPALLTETSNIALSSSGCTDLCAKFLVDGKVGSVVTGPPLNKKLQPDESMGPFVRWSLTHDPEFCGTEEAQAAFWRVRSQKSLLAQGYCFRGEKTEDGSADYRFAQNFDYPGDITAPGNRFTQSVFDRDGSILIRMPTWRFDMFISPPFLFWTTNGMRWVRRGFADGPFEADFIQQAFGIRPDYHLDSIGSVFIDDPRAAIASAARSPSVYMRKSALALICAVGWERRDESREEIALLNAPDDQWIRATARALSNWTPGTRPCGALN